jgi:hypothetical protein
MRRLSTKLVENDIVGENSCHATFLRTHIALV